MIFEKSGGAVDWLIVGLGNPGQKYEHTRHNMGFLTVDLLAEQLNVKLNKVKFKSAYNIVRFGGQKCLVMKPQTYMTFPVRLSMRLRSSIRSPPIMCW